MDIKMYVKTALVILLLSAFNPAFAQTAFNIKDSTGVSLFYVRSDGNTGIGTVNPLVRLQVIGDIRASVLKGIGSRLLFADENGTLFARGTLPKPAWSLTGNSGLSDSIFLGTTDMSPLVFRTGGSTLGYERMRITGDGRITVNNPQPRPGDLFAVYGSGTPGSVNSYISAYPFSSYSTGNYSGVYGENRGDGQGILGVNLGSGTGVLGQSASDSGTAVTGQNFAAGYGVFGVSEKGFGVNGQTEDSLTAGVRGFNRSDNGTGIVALGNNIPSPKVIGNGSGLSANGREAGAFAIGRDFLSGTGVVASGNDLSVLTGTRNGAGVNGNGTGFGVTGFAASDSALTVTSSGKWGGYFDNTLSSSGYAYIGGRINNTDFGIVTPGANATVINGKNGESSLMFAPAATEVLLQDYGTGKLEKGTAHILLDPVFSEMIFTDEANPIKVFVQVEGECNGVFVTNKSKEGFEVKELNGGKSGVSFSWQVVAKRMDLLNPEGGVESGYSSLRLPAGIKRPEQVKLLVKGMPDYQQPVQSKGTKMIRKENVKK
ncbi:MAG: hypothetical protein ACM3S2_16865 [Ignavibacteriales bacterium]